MKLKKQPLRGKVRNSFLIEEKLNHLTQFFLRLKEEESLYLKKEINLGLFYIGPS